MSSDLSNMTNDFNVPVVELDSLGMKEVIEQFKLAIVAIIEEKTVIEIDDFEQLLNEIYKKNNIVDAPIKNYIKHQATKVIDDNYRVNLFNAESLRKAKSSRLSSHLLLATISSGAVAILLPTVLILKLASFGVTWIVSAVGFGMMFGQDPKYSKHVHATAKAYGEQIYDYLSNPENYSRLAEQYNKEKLAKLSQPVIYS